MENSPEFILDSSRASGAGKSMSRKCFISDPLEYIKNNKKVDVKDFEISKFTRAGKYLM